MLFHRASPITRVLLSATMGTYFLVATRRSHTVVRMGIGYLCYHPARVFPWLSSRIQPSGSFKDILPSLCNNITARLDEQEEELGNTCLRQCQLGFNINITTKFTYSNLAFRV